MLISAQTHIDACLRIKDIMVDTGNTSLSYMLVNVSSQAQAFDNYPEAPHMECSPARSVMKPNCGRVTSGPRKNHLRAALRLINALSWRLSGGLCDNPNRSQQPHRQAARYYRLIASCIATKIVCSSIARFIPIYDQQNH